MTLFFIHGIFENSLCWVNWTRFFQEHGYKCLTADYPYHEGKPEDLRHLLNEDLKKITLNDVYDHYVKKLTVLPQPPVVIGHSMGGLIAQKLIEQGKAAAAILVQPAPPAAVFGFDMKFFKLHFQVINPFKGNSLCVPSKSWYHQAVANTLTRCQSDEAYEKTLVPESRNIPRTTRQWAGRINLTQPHNPMLFISGEKDNAVPAFLVKRNYKAYTDSASVKDYKEYPGMSHYILREKGWEKPAEDALEWLRRIEEKIS